MSLCLLPPPLHEVFDEIPVTAVDCYHPGTYWKYRTHNCEISHLVYISCLTSAAIFIFSMSSKTPADKHRFFVQDFLLGQISISDLRYIRDVYNPSCEFQLTRWYNHHQSPKCGPSHSWKHRRLNRRLWDRSLLAQQTCPKGSDLRPLDLAACGSKAR